MSAALLAAAAQLGGSLFNYYGQTETNEATHAHSLAMYNRQRDDNYKMWQLQNNYNTPQAQMQRLRDAGLNPHLVYGKGADATAGPVATASPQPWNPTAPTLDVNSPINTYFDTELKSAQTDNLRVMNTVNATEAAIKAQELHAKDRDNKIADGLVDTTTALAQEQLRKARIENNYTAERADREQELHPLNMQNALEQALNSRSARETQGAQRDLYATQIKEIKASTELKQLDALLKRQGFNPNGSVYERIIGNIINEITNGRSIYSVVGDYLKGKWKEFTNW